ncbi:hypothetical protein B9Z19DRAFT_735168 [Tuber borchii]|uniref:Uncharacterized protein n=1 Tax=Tuber borchii TaxID=42251 RepID=A0A2T6ZY78_TUBBO|nr:hypothetical protein B9Z19DRAFT_735168 [Tuber borchii]
MAKKSSPQMMASAVVTSKALERILCLEAEVSRLRHHVSVLSKRIHKLDPPRRKSPRPVTSPSPVIEEDILRSDSVGPAGGKAGVAEEKPPVADDEGGGMMAVALADNMAVAKFEAGAVAIQFRGKRRRVEEFDEKMEEDVVVGDKIVPLGVLESEVVEVVEVGSSTVVPSAPRAIRGLVGREVVHGAPTGPGGRGGTGVGMGPSGGRGLNGFGLRSDRCFGPIGVAFRGDTRGFYARGRGRGRGWGG